MGPHMQGTKINAGHIHDVRVHHNEIASISDIAVKLAQILGKQLAINETEAVATQNEEAER